jgi:hypothetical protein
MLELRNRGTAPLTGSVQLRGEEHSNFRLRSDCGTLPVEGSCSIAVTFAPLTAGPKAARESARGGRQRAPAYRHWRTVIALLNETAPLPIATATTAGRRQVSIRAGELLRRQAPIKILLNPSRES